MSPRRSRSALAVVALAGCAAAVFAEPIPPPRPVGGGGSQPAGTPALPPPPAGAKPPAEEKLFTAFPDLVPVGKGPEVKPQRGWRPWPGPGPRPLEKLTAPVPADAPLLRKVQIAQFREGYSYLARVRIRIDIGSFQSSDFNEYLEMQAAVYRLAADLADTPDEKVWWHEAAVWEFWQAYRFAEARVAAGNDPPHSLSLARFGQLAAEADLVRAMEAARRAK